MSKNKNAIQLYSFSIGVRATIFFWCYVIFANAEISSIHENSSALALTQKYHMWQPLGG